MAECSGVGVAGDTGSVFVEEESCPFIKKLPAELKVNILRYLPRYEIENLRLVCKDIKNLIDQESRRLPKRIFQRMKISYNSKTKCFIVRVKCPHDSKLYRKAFPRVARKRSPSDNFCPLLIKGRRLDDDITTRDLAQHDDLHNLPSTSADEVTNTEVCCLNDNFPIALSDYLTKMFWNANVDLLEFEEIRPFSNFFLDSLLKQFRSFETRIQKLRIRSCSIESSASSTRSSSSALLKQILEVVKPIELTLQEISGVTAAHFDKEFFEIVKNLKYLDINTITVGTGKTGDHIVFDWETVSSIEAPLMCLGEKTMVGNCQVRELIKEVASGVRNVENWLITSAHLNPSVIFDDMTHRKIHDGLYEIENVQIEFNEDGWMIIKKKN